MASLLKEDKLEGWTKYEKFDLLEAVRLVGPDAVKLKDLVNKTEDEIQVALDYYIRQYKKQTPTPPKIERKVKVPTEPLADWAKFIMDAHGPNDFPVETATALRLVADFEDRPSADMTEIDFKKIYHTMADALEGKPINPDRNTEIILNKCLVETALASKALSKGTIIKDILKSACNPEEAGVSAFTTPTEDPELITLRSIISKKNYNPLNIPEEKLRLASQNV